VVIVGIILTLAAILDALCFNLAQLHSDQNTLTTYNDQQKSVTVEGVVGEPDVRDTYTDLRVEADHLLISNLLDSVTRTVKGLVLVQMPPFTD
jgi:hypothetical protein